MEERNFFDLFRITISFKGINCSFVSKSLTLGCFPINDRWTTFIPTLIVGHVDGLRKLKRLKPKLTFTSLML